MVDLIKLIWIKFIRGSVRKSTQDWLRNPQNVPLLLNTCNIDDHTGGAPPNSFASDGNNDGLSAVGEVISQLLGKKKTFLYKSTIIVRGVSDQMRQSIWQNKYKELVQLLPTDTVRQMRTYQMDTAKLVDSVELWQNAFNIYVSIYTAKHPESAPGLMQYM